MRFARPYIRRGRPISEWQRTGVQAWRAVTARHQVLSGWQYGDYTILTGDEQPDLGFRHRCQGGRVHLDATELAAATGASCADSDPDGTACPRTVGGHVALVRDATGVVNISEDEYQRAVVRGVCREHWRLTLHVADLPAVVETRERFRAVKPVTVTVGDVVTHPEHGGGIVMECDDPHWDQRATVQFNDRPDPREVLARGLRVDVRAPAGAPRLPARYDLTLDGALARVRAAAARDGAAPVGTLIEYVAQALAEFDGVPRWIEGGTPRMDEYRALARTAVDAIRRVTAAAAPPSPQVTPPAGTIRGRIVSGR